MASNMALRRSRKASRRKAVIADRRKAEASAASLPSLVRRAAAGPILHCCLHENLFETGMGTLVVARGAPGETVVCTFLLDTYCLGIKDVFVVPATMARIELIVETLQMTAPLKAVAPAYARKLLHELAAWAQSIGFSPHRDFAAAELILGGADVASCEDTFNFGRDGKPFYVAGPDDPPALVHQRMQRLSERVDSDRFHHIPADDEAVMPELSGRHVDAEPSSTHSPPPQAE